MANPKLSYKSDGILTVNHDIKKLFKTIYQGQNQKDKDTDQIPKIKVSEFISKMAFYYEKLRNTVDYKEEYLLRKNAILRILRRLIVIEGAINLQEYKSEDISKNLLTELIRAGYLPNNKIPEDKIEEISEVIEKYVQLKKYSLSNNQDKSSTEKNDITKWILVMAACDIEERLGRSKTEQVIISNMYDYLKDKIQLPVNSSYQQDKDIQIYIGIHRALLKFDKDLVGFILFKYYNSDWHKGGEESIKEIGKNINPLRASIDKQIDHPISKQLNKIIRRYTGFYTILTDVIEEDPGYVYESFRSDPKAFPRDIKKICNKRYKFAKIKLWRAAIRSIIYIFITKSLFVIILEAPAIKWFGEELNPVSLVINIGFPAVLLFFAVLFTKLPSKANTDKIIEGVNEIVFKENEREEPFVLQKAVKRKKLTNFIFGIFYAITFFFSFGLVIWGLGKIEFNFISITIFLFFLAFVSFFALRIRNNARELTVIEPKETIISFFIDFFYTPIIAAGKWLSEKFSRINVFVFFLDFIIEAPFKIFVETAEEWTKYVKERKEDLM